MTSSVSSGSTTSRPDPPATTVRPVVAGDAPWLARALAAAFHDDPFWAWLVPGEKGRTARYERFCRLLVLPSMLPYGISTTTEGVAGGALWLPPGAAQLGVWDQLRLLPALARVAGRRAPRLLRGFSTLEAHEPQEEHLHLALLGVTPVWQGRGIGSALMRPMLDRADAEGMPAYLEATTPESRALYERHGFVTRDLLELPDGGPPLWLMWREPQG